MNDNHIVDLYWARDADAIKESSEKYGGFCFSMSNRSRVKMYICLR